MGGAYETSGKIGCRSGTGSANGQTGSAQPAENPGTGNRKQPRKLSKKKRRRLLIRGLSVLALAALIFAVALIVRSCNGKADALKGTWDLDGVTVYYFDGKGNGSLNLPEISYAFTYSIQDGTLYIDFESEAARDREYAFTADKNTLTLTDGKGKESKTFSLTKKAD